MRSNLTQRLSRTVFRRPGLCLFLFLLAVAGGVPGMAQRVEVYVSSKAGDRLTAKKPLQFESQNKPASAPAFRVDESVTYQTMTGFGASFLEAGMICLNRLDTNQQEAVLRALFDPEKGAGFSAMKTVIAGTDFMSAGPWYSYDDTPGDVELNRFSVQRDLGANGLIPYIRRAKKYGSFFLQAPMDYPPDWMLFDVNKHQDVDPKYYDALAHYYLRYLREYEKNGVFIDYLSLFNEPGIYTKIPYTEIRDLFRDYVGPLFAKEQVKTKLCFSEAEDRESAAKNYPTVLDDPGARPYVSILPYHGYRWQSSEPITGLHKRYPDLPIWQTEVCHAYDAGTPRSMHLPRRDFQDGDFWGNLIVTDLEEGASAWIYWNMILDQKGGPWLTSPVHEDPDPNVQHPVVIINSKKKEVTYTGLYYYLAHFSRFVRPRSVRVGVSGNPQGVRCIAFKRPDGRFVAELLNSRKSPAQVRLDWRNRSLEVTLPAVSITSCLWQ